MRRWLAILLVALFLTASFTAEASGTSPFSFALTASEGRENNGFDLTLEYDGRWGNLGAFVFWVDFDAERFVCKSVNLVDGLKENYTVTAEPREGQVAVVYTQKSAGLAYGGPSTAITCRFKVNKGASPGAAEFRVRMEQVLSPDGESLCPDVDETLTYDVLEPLSTDCALLNLVPSTGELDQPFSPDVFAYTMSVPYSVTRLTFDAEPVEGATYKVNRQTLGAEGSTTQFVVTVTAADGKTKQTYQVDVYREPRSNDCTLQWLAPDTGELDQPFSPDRLNYTMTVPTDVTSLTFIYEAAEGAKCTVNRKNLGAAGSETEFRFTVTAEDTKTKEIYRVTVYREPVSSEALLSHLEPDTGAFEQEFSPTRYHYTMTVASDVAEMGFTAVPVDGATCKADGKKLGGMGSTTTFKITVTAADGKTKQVYQVDVTREDDPAAHDCTLISLMPPVGELSPDFSPDVTDYTLTVPYTVTSLIFEAEAAEGATWKVNRKNLGSGGSDTEFIFTVTAADKKTKQTYRVKVHREEQVKATASPTPKVTATSTPKAATATATPKPTKTPKPSATPTPSPSPSAIPVPVEEDSAAISPPPLGISDAPASASAQESVNPFAYAGFTGLAVAAIFLSGPVSQWIEKRRGK